MKLTNLLAGAALAAICTGSVASAAVLYDNGPLNIPLGGWTITSGQAIGDTFTLTSAATVTGVNFGAITFTGQQITFVDWGITSVFGIIPDHGPAAVTTGPVQHSGGFDIGFDSFSTGVLHLAAGTYYLWLQNAVSSGGSDSYWDINNGPSDAYFAELGTFIDTVADNDGPGTNSNAFQIIGPAGVVPEPATWAMMLAGFGGLGAVMRSRRKALSLAA